MTNEEKAKEISDSYHMPDTGFNREDMYSSAMEMAGWKDHVFNGFIFELSMLLTSPKTSLDHAICTALPMTGLNAIDEVGDFLREKLWEYEHNGTILKNE